MIGYLQGKLLARAPQVVLVDVRGVGYEVHIPLSTFYELEKLGDAAEVGLHVHTHVREDAITLFGFRTEREKRLFEKLIGVSGIGPRLAQTALSGMAPDDLVAALAAGDVRRLATIPGVGKKTAERMVLELRDKVEALAGGAPRRTAGEEEDLVLALVNLGYKRSDAERAHASVARDHPDLPFPERLRASLKLLSRV